MTHPLEPKMIEDKYYEVRYLVHFCYRTSPDDASRVDTAAGVRRIWLSDLYQWLIDNPGTMLVSMREI